MLSLISKVVSFFIDDTKAPQSRNESLSNGAETDSLSSQAFVDAPFVIKDSEEFQIRVFTGKISHVFHGHGLVDGDVYFSMENILDNNKPQIGDLVHVRASQLFEDGGWYAKEISVVDKTWDKDEDKPMDNGEEEINLDELQREALIGKITFFANNNGKIDKDIDFRSEDCSDGFIPRAGDWVSANIAEEKETREIAVEDNWSEKTAITLRRAFNVQPLRVMHVEGIVTAIMSDHGYINGEIFFTRESCLNSYKPRKHDAVKVSSVESAQGKCQWRAVSVVPLSSESDAYRSKQFRNPAKQIGGSWLVPGQRPKGFRNIVILPVKLPHFTVPQSLETYVMESRELTDMIPVLMQPLTFVNYVKRMSILLHLEEIQMQMDIREFDLNRVCLRPAGQYLALTVPGLAEGRPSVLVGDKIILSSPSDPDGPSYEGYAHEITCSDVHLLFNPAFHSRYNGEDYNVVFTFSRVPLRRSHQAVSLAVQYLGSSVLFPSQVTLKSPQVKLEDIMPLEETIVSESSTSDLNNSASYRSSNTASSCYSPAQHHHSARFSSQTNGASEYEYSQSKSVQNEVKTSTGHAANASTQQTLKSNSIQRLSKSYSPKKKGFQFFNPKLNEQQRSAVMKILLGQSRPIPYVIFGPPGTGKTITVVEAILQVLTRIPSSRIIACTPSNSAADLIAERLHNSGQVEQTQMVRFNAFQRSLENIPEAILKYCKFADDLKVISRYRVIVCTCVMSGALYGLGLSAGHVTHVFVDECGQATEPECLIPCGIVSGTDGQIVLAGDPKQLHPIVMSPFAKMYGLELSFLERLMDRPPYLHNSDLFADQGGFDSALVTMLINNYRSHPSILELPSQLFYYNQLQPFAEPSLTYSLADWNMLPTPGFPVVFHGIRGEDVREETSPSWFNPGETVQVVRYLQGLLREGVKPEDIGIITPYRKQVDKVRLMIERLAMPDVKVGSVEEFQGQERQVIIISTVRSNERLVGFDVRHSLGFLSNPKRFNVAITRAQALLILVGNPYVLAQDCNWRCLIKFCADNGGYTGCELPDIKRLEKDEQGLEIDTKNVSH